MLSRNPIGFHLTPGQACDLDGADVLLNELAADTLLADKGYDADECVIERLQEQGKMAVGKVSSHTHRCSIKG